MKNCLWFWRANHNIQPALNPCCCVTKAQKGMSAIMDKACKEAIDGNMNLKQSVRHMVNAFLNGEETPQQEATFLALQMAVTRMSRDSVFLHTSRPDERAFLLRLCYIERHGSRIRGYTESQYTDTLST